MAAGKEIVRTPVNVMSGVTCRMLEARVLRGNRKREL